MTNKADLDLLLSTLEKVYSDTRSIIHDLQLDPAEAERRRLSKLLGRVSNRMFGHNQVFPSNLLDVIAAWLGGYELKWPLEKTFYKALEEAEDQLEKEAQLEKEEAL